MAIEYIYPEFEVVRNESRWRRVHSVRTTVRK